MPSSGGITTAGRAYVDVVVQVSDDPAFKTAVKTIFNNDTDDSLGLGAGQDLSYVETYEGKLIEGKGARPLRATVQQRQRVG